jgi:hypothetical protein
MVTLQSGDRHNDAGVTHVVDSYAAPGNFDELQRTIIHETAHALGYSETAAMQYEDLCYQEDEM